MYRGARPRPRGGGRSARCLRDAVVEPAVLAVLIAPVYVYPELRFLSYLGADYPGIPPIAAADETTNPSRVTRVLVGDPLPGNAMILEHRADRYTYAPLLEIVLRTVGRLFGLSIVQLDIMATAVLPAIVFVPVRAMTRVF